MKHFIIMLCLLANSSFVSAQLAQDCNQLQAKIEAKKTLLERFTFAKSDPSNEVLIILSGAFLAYKAFFSSQDAGSCSFTPSCSEYALQTIQKHGVITGGIAFFDRFQRCHPFNTSYYKKHPASGLNHDPIE